MINHLLAIGTIFCVGYLTGRILRRSEMELQAEENIKEANRIISNNNFIQNGTK